MRIERRRGYRVVVGGPVPPQADAITLGRTIIVRKAVAAHQGLLAHELVHVRQFIDLGPPQFFARYVGSYLKLRLAGHGHMAAYRRIPLEVEASWISRLQSVPELEPTAPSAGSKRRANRRAGAGRARYRPTSIGQAATTMRGARATTSRLRSRILPPRS